MPDEKGKILQREPRIYLDRAFPFIGEAEWSKPGEHFSTSEGAMLFAFAQLIYGGLETGDLNHVRALVLTMVREAIHRGPGAPGYDVYASLLARTTGVGIPSTRPPWLEPHS